MKGTYGLVFLGAVAKVATTLHLHKHKPIRYVLAVPLITLVTVKHRSSESHFSFSTSLSPHACV